MVEPNPSEFLPMPATEKRIPGDSRLSTTFEGFKAGGSCSDRHPTVDQVPESIFNVQVVSKAHRDVEMGCASSGNKEIETQPQLQYEL